MYALMAMMMAPLFCGAAARQETPRSSPSPANLGGVSRIIGGSAAGACQLPSMVGMKVGPWDSSDTSRVNCTGSLVHPQIVIYAPHCTTNISAIVFGKQFIHQEVGRSETYELSDSERQIDLPPKSCKVYPGSDLQNGSDFAYCKLPEEVKDIPFTPVLAGCEVAALVAGSDVILGGFGLTDDTAVNPYATRGAKMSVPASIQGISGNRVIVGPSGAGLCGGDSGGPIYLRLNQGNRAIPGADDSWRVISVNSYVGDRCGTFSVGSLITAAIPWIEADSGIDITPCYDSDGTWNPTAACANFPTDLFDVSGDVKSGCKFNKVTQGPIKTCGTAAGPIQLLSPNAQGLGDQNTQPVELWVSVPNANVTASLDGTALTPLPNYQAPQMGFGPVSWSAGKHMLQVTATTASTDANQPASIPLQKSFAITVGDGATQTVSSGVDNLGAIVPVVGKAKGCRSIASSDAWAIALAWMAGWRCRRRASHSPRRAGTMLAALSLATLGGWGCNLTGGTSTLSTIASDGSDTGASGSRQVAVEVVSDSVPAQGTGDPNAVTLLPEGSVSLTGALTPLGVPATLGAKYNYYLLNDPNIGLRGMVMSFSTRSSLCIDHLVNIPLEPGTIELRIAMVSTLPPPSAIFEGKFQILERLKALAAPSESQFAYGYLVNTTGKDAAITSTCTKSSATLPPDTLLEIMTGSIEIHPHFTASGFYYTGEFSTLLTDKFMTLSGTFTAANCPHGNGYPIITIDSCF